MLEFDAYDCSRHALRKPAWWLLYLVGLLLVGGVGLLERVLPDSPIVILDFGLTLLWRHCNRARWS